MQSPYLLFLGDETNIESAKTAAGLAHWRAELCMGQCRLAKGTLDLGLKDFEIGAAAKKGAKTLVIGIAPFGGEIDDAWLPVIFDAMEKGLDIAAGLHHRLNDHQEICRVAKKFNCTLYDVRQPSDSFMVATGDKRTGKRLLTVGTDCAVGKKYTSLAIEKEMRSRGLNADYRATGQTGVFIAGGGFSVDAVVSDFLAGAVETLSPNNHPDHWDIIEGQGSLFHPSYAAVTVGLIHGSQPDNLVLCHDATRNRIEDAPNYPIPEFSKCMQDYLAIASLTNKNAKFVGISINTSGLQEAESIDYIKITEEKYNLPCCDPVRSGIASIVDCLDI